MSLCWSRCDGIWSSCPLFKSLALALLFVMSLEELQNNLRGFAALSQMSVWKTFVGMVLCFLSSVSFIRSCVEKDLAVIPLKLHVCSTIANFLLTI